VPFWEAFYRRLGGVYDEQSFSRIVDSGLGYMSKDMVTASGISPETRYSFWRAFGMLPDEQEALESLVVDIDYGQRAPLTFGDVRPLSELLRQQNRDEATKTENARSQPAEHQLH